MGYYSRNYSLEDYLDTLNESDYLFVANTLLGNISSSTRKKDLNQDIIKFFKNKDNQANILAALDDEDKKYLTFLSIVDEVSYVKIIHFFSSGCSYDVTSKLDDLQNRLLILRIGYYCFINPELKNAISSVINLDNLFGKSKEVVSLPFVDKNVVFAIINLLINDRPSKRELTARQEGKFCSVKATAAKLNKLEKIFPHFKREQIQEFYNKIKSFLLSEKILTLSEDSYIVDVKKVSSLMSLDGLSLITCIIGASNDNIFLRILGNLKYHSIDRSQLISMIDDFTNYNAYSVIADMKSFGAISITDNECSVKINPALANQTVPRSKLNVDSNMEISYYGEPDSSDFLYLFAEIQACDTLVRYIINKSSFSKALDQGVKSTEISNYIGTDRFDQQFAQWEESFSRVKLYDGIVIKSDSTISSVVANHPKLKDHILQNFGNGVLVMNRSTYSKWSAALAYAMDLKHLPSLISGCNEETEESSSFDVNAYIVPDYNITKNTQQIQISSDELREKLLKDAEKKGCLTENVKDLINEKLIVSTSQIGKNFKYPYRQIISGFDYQKKLTAIRTLLRKYSYYYDMPLVKIEFSDESKIIVAKPYDLIRERNNIVLRLYDARDHEEVKVPISTIFKLTVLRWIIYD